MQTDESKTEGVAAVTSSAVLAAVERLRATWGERAYYLEELSGNEKDAISLRHHEHAKIIRRCISELYQEVEAATP